MSLFDKPASLSRRSKWANRLLLVAVVTVLVVGLYSLADLGLRQLRFNNCLRQLEALEMRRVYVSEPFRSGMYRTTEGLDEWGQDMYALLCGLCQVRRWDVDKWPR